MSEVPISASSRAENPGERGVGQSDLSDQPKSCAWTGLAADGQQWASTESSLAPVKGPAGSSLVAGRLASDKISVPGGYWVGQGPG